MLMIIFHHSYNWGFTDLGGRLLVNKLYSVSHWGYLATGVFFFLSGFGLYYSITKKGLQRDWLIKHMKKMFKPFIFLWVFYVVCFILYNPKMLEWNLLTELITLRSPGRDTWFFRVIVGAYITTFIIFRYIKSEKICLAVLGIVVSIYVIIMAKYSTGPWWYNSIFNFPIGMLCAYYYKYIDNVPDYFVIFLSTACYLLFYRYLKIDILESLSFTFIVVWLVKYIDIRSRYLHFVGVESLSFYFLESPIKQFICKPYFDNYWLFTISSIVVTSAIVLLYRFISSRVRI